jgi:predicted amidohydrolase YtcJ
LVFFFIPFEIFFFLIKWIESKFMATNLTAMKKIDNILFLFILLVFANSSCSEPETAEADLILVNGKIWTGDENFPWANWIAIKGDRIIELGKLGDNMPNAKESIDLNGQLTLPGFNDSHVHFAQAGHLLSNINLLDINDADGFITRVNEVAKRLPEGSWITRGDWGAYEAWAMGSAGGDTRQRAFMPNRLMIDSVSPKHPVLVTRFDRQVGLANQAALDFLGLSSNDGILKGDELQMAMRSIPEKSFEQKVTESKRALAEAAKYGVTTFQDMSPMDQVDVYEHLRKNGGLTARVNFAPSRLSDYEMMAQRDWTIRDRNGVVGPAGDEMISFGTLKTHVDGIMGSRTALFYEPYSDNSVENRTWRGGWREFSNNLGNFKKMIIEADKQNIQLRVHAIGDYANALLLDILDSLEVVNGPKERRFRLVHAQVISPGDFERLRNKGVVAEVQPYHVTDDMRWMEERIGFERNKGAYAFKTLQDMGCILSFGSDWPGTNASYYPINPLLGLYAAVTRQTLAGEPEEGWFPGQKLSLEDALKAYTWGSAYGAFEDHLKGTLSPGKLADIVVVDTDLFETEPEKWINANFSLTFLGGKIVYRKE